MLPIQRFLIAILTLSFFACSELHAGFVSPVINLSAGTDLVNDGEFIGHKKISLRAGNMITGKGLIKSPEIDIATKTFAFTGTIECSGSCTIRAEEPFDETMFKRAGGGTFTIIIEPLKPLEEPAFKMPEFTMPEIISSFDVQNGQREKDWEAARQQWKERDAAIQENQRKIEEASRQREEKIKQREKEWEIIEQQRQERARAREEASKKREEELKQREKEREIIEQQQRERARQQSALPVDELVQRSFAYINAHIETISEKALHEVIAEIKYLALNDEAFHEVLLRLRDKLSANMRYHERKMLNRFDKREFIAPVIAAGLTLVSGALFYYVMNKRFSDINALKAQLNDMNVRVDCQNHLMLSKTQIWVTWPEGISKNSRREAEDIIKKIWDLRIEKLNFVDGVLLGASLVSGASLFESLRDAIKNTWYSDPRAHKKPFECYQEIVRILEQVQKTELS